MRIKVLIVVNELLRGGAQRMIAGLAETIDKQRFDLRIVTLISPSVFSLESNTFNESILAAGIPITAMEGGARFRLREFVRLRSYFKKERPDVVHTFLPFAGVIGRVAARLAGVPCIISTQCNLPVAYTKKIYWLDRLTLPLAHAWTGATQAIELHYGGSTERVQPTNIRRGRRHFTIVAGVDVALIEKTKQATHRMKKREEIGIPPDARMVLMTARLVSWKGHQESITALAHLPKNYHMVFVGWGPLEASLREQASRLGVLDRLHFLLTRFDIYELLGATDIYLQTFSYSPQGTIWSGPNIAVMEAATAGVPIVASRVPLIETLIEDGVTGVLANIGDAADIARALLWVDTHRHEAERMVNKARQRIHDFYSLRAMTTQHEELYIGMLTHR